MSDPVKDQMSIKKNIANLKPLEMSELYWAIGVKHSEQDGGDNEQSLNRTLVLKIGRTKMWKTKKGAQRKLDNLVDSGHLLAGKYEVHEQAMWRLW